MNLTGKNIVITGVSTKESIAFAVAREAQLAGAEVVLTSFGRMRRLTERTAARLPYPPDVLELDVNQPGQVAELAGELRRRWGRVDGVLHAVAFAPEDALGGNFMATPTESALTAFQTSAFSFKTLAAGLVPLFGSGGASVVGLDFDASVAWPAYDWMGVAKAALEAVSRYLARDLGRLGVRVNLVAAGPLRTLALKGIPGIDSFKHAWDERSPLGWDMNDATPVAQTVCFLLSDWARAITAEIVHVDGGFHALGVPAPPAGAAELIDGNGAQPRPATAAATG